MNRILIICLCVIALAGCKKSDKDFKNIQEQAKFDDNYIQQYINDNHLTATKVMIGREDTTGIWYINTRTGTDNTLLTNSSLLTVGYTCRNLATGDVFAKTDDVHPAFHLGDMIKGWAYGITASQIKKGGKIRLLIASRYAYGPFPQDDYHLPADAILDCDIELFDVTN